MPEDEELEEREELDGEPEDGELDEEEEPGDGDEQPAGGRRRRREPEPLPERAGLDDEEWFQALLDRWDEDTVYVSNFTRMSQHPAYLAMLEMGDAAVPIMLRRMRDENTRRWVLALGRITGEIPYPPRDRFDAEAMRRAWLEWGVKNGNLEPEEGE